MPPKHAEMPDGFGSAGEFDERRESTFAAVSIAAKFTITTPAAAARRSFARTIRQTSWNSGNGDGRTTWADEIYGAGESSSGATTAIYVYKTETGAPFMRVRRTADKKFPTEAWMGRTGKSIGRHGRSCPIDCQSSWRRRWTRRRGHLRGRERLRAGRSAWLDRDLQLRWGE